MLRAGHLLAALLSRQDRAVFQNSESVTIATEVRGISRQSYAGYSGKK